ncbi:MAG: hypothetical protein ACM37W_10060 [Actinomycetota bacterium]
MVYDCQGRSQCIQRSTLYLIPLKMTVLGQSQPSIVNRPESTVATLFNF